MDTSRVRYRRPFPNRTKENSRQTSDPDEGQNCFGYAARLNVVMSPFPDFYFWPKGITRGRDLASFLSAYKLLGFEESDSLTVESGIEKVAIYGWHDSVQHAARQKPNGKWTSKMGVDEDIEHDTLEVLSGGQFGNVIAILKRPQ